MSTASTVLSSSWAMVLAIVSLPIVLHGLGPRAFGTWVLVQTFSAFTGWLSLADLGVGVATVRRVADRAAVDDHVAVRRVVSTSLTIFLVGGLISSALLAGLGPRLLPSVLRIPRGLVADFRFALVVFAVQALAELLSAGMYSCIEGLQRVDVARLVDMARRTSVAAGTAVVASTGGGLRGVAVVSCAATVAGTGLALVALRWLLPTGFGRPSSREAMPLAKYAATVGVLQSTGVLHRTMDRVIVGALIGPVAVTLVEIANQVQNGASAMLSAASYVATSSSSWVRARGGKELQELVLLGTKYSLLLTLPVIVCPLVLASPLVEIWVGPAYSPAAELVVLALLYLLLLAPLQVGSNFLQGVGRAAAVLQPAALAVAVNLVASVVLVHLIGVRGTFVGTLISSFVLAPALLRAVLREVGARLGSFVSSAIAPCLFPAVAIAAVCALALGLGLPPLSTVVSGAAVGFTSYVFIVSRSSLGPAERAELVRHLRRTG